MVNSEGVVPALGQLGFICSRHRPLPIALLSPGSRLDAVLSGPSECILSEPVLVASSHPRGAAFHVVVLSLFPLMPPSLELPDTYEKHSIVHYPSWECQQPWW